MKNTITSLHHFRRLRKEGILIKSKGLLLVHVNYEGPALYGLTVSKKISKRAVDRNLVKRRYRAILSEVFDKYKKENILYNFIATPNTLNREYEALKKDFVWALNQVNNGK